MPRAYPPWARDTLTRFEPDSTREQMAFSDLLTMVDPRERNDSDRAASLEPNEMRAMLAMIEDEHPVSRPRCAEDGTPRPGAVL